MPSARQAPATIKVWDPFVRIFHWSLFLCIAVAALSGYVLGASWLGLHLLAGATAAALVLARIVWGVLGSRYARFSGFVAGPGAVLAHLRELTGRNGDRHVGHNPLGGWMIVVLLVAIGLSAITGTIFLGGALKAGPGAFLSFGFANPVRALHLGLANLLMLLVALHVLGALFESWRSRENLPRAMLTGRKEARKGDHLPPERRARTALAAVLGAVALGASVLGLSALARLPVPGLPVAELDPLYADECAACHVAFNPSLLGRDDWRAMMAALESHFGEDASLDPETEALIGDWLAAHAAETADIRAAHVFVKTDPAHPYTITAAPFWKRHHAAIAGKVFETAPVYSRANCPACHKDAEKGLFYPANISIPKETKK